MMRIELRVEGHVQGVGFRYQALGLAQKQDLTGWVRNNDDGSVTVQVQGAPQDIEAFKSGLLTSMRFAVIEHIFEKPLKLQEEKSFRIVG